MIIVFAFYFISKWFLIYLTIYWLFNSVLFNHYVFCFVCSWFLVSYHCGQQRSLTKFWFSSKYWDRIMTQQVIYTGGCFMYQFSSVPQSCATLCNPMNCSEPGLPVHHQCLQFTQTHAHRVSDAIQPSHPLPSPSPPSPNPSQHQSLFQWVNSSHEVAKVLESQI